MPNIHAIQPEHTLHLYSILYACLENALHPLLLPRCHKENNGQNRISNTLFMSVDLVVGYRFNVINLSLTSISIHTRFCLLSPLRWADFWHWQWPECSSTRSSLGTLHHRLQHLRHDAALQWNKCPQDPWRTQCLWRNIQQCYLLHYRLWHIYYPGIQTAIWCLTFRVTKPSCIEPSDLLWELLQMLNNKLLFVIMTVIVIIVIMTIIRGSSDYVVLMCFLTNATLIFICFTDCDCAVWRETFQLCGSEHRPVAMVCLPGLWLPPLGSGE